MSSSGSAEEEQVVKVRQEPEEVESEGHEEVLQRAAAIDVAKASGMVCTRTPHPSHSGKRVTKVWQVGSTTNAIAELADHLAGESIERVVLESTSDYWRREAWQSGWSTLNRSSRSRDVPRRTSWTRSGCAS